MDSNKWIMFKNYMHNELRITKDDIQAWVVDAVTQQAKKALSEYNYANRIDELIIKRIDDIIKGNTWNSKSFNDEIISKVVKDLSSQIRLTVK
jgi:hypothetical protein